MRMGLIALSFGLSAAIAGACGENTDTEDSQTHWLDECENDGECGAFHCECGRCVARPRKHAGLPRDVGRRRRW